MGQDIKHHRFYVDLGSWEDTRQTLEYFEEIADRCNFPIYATLQEIKLANDARGIRVGLAHTTEQAKSMFPAKWMVAAQDKRVPLGFMDSDEITVNRDVDWVVKDLNPGLVEDYQQN